MHVGTGISDFRPARNDFNFGNKKKSLEGVGVGGGGWNSCNYCGGMSVGFVMQKTDMFKTSGRASFLIIL